MKRGFSLLFFGVVLATLYAPLVSVAQTSEGGLITECDRATTTIDPVTGNPITTVDNRCGIEEFVNQFVKLAQYGITIVLFLAVLMLVYGGFEFITAGGRQSKISSGQNIITGTVIGLLISFSAFVIINFVVGAITGTKTSNNPFTAIATVFGRPEQKNSGLTKPFSGEGEAAPPGCRTEWDNCTDQILCADSVDQSLSGPIASNQARLNQLGCACGTIDGCFGAQTLTCVRRFQIANTLVSSGTIDQATNDALAEANPVRCDGAIATAQIKGVLAALPTPTANVSGTPTGSRGCCIINNNISGSALTPLYCIEDLDQRACEALYSDSYFTTKGCTQDSHAIDVCGFCKSTSGTCFQQTGQYWCEKVAKEAGSTTPLTFAKGLCTGLTNICGGGCDSTLKTTP